MFWNLTDAAGDPPSILYSAMGAQMSHTVAARGGLPEHAVTFLLGVRMHDTGRVRLASADPSVNPIIETGFFANPADVDSALRALDTARTIGRANALDAFLQTQAVGLRCSLIHSSVRSTVRGTDSVMETAREFPERNP
ncbi:GMC oxidoreductase [Promicromonospora sp. NPDC052451]|uniref:GMC oxidoreductase n=1 Tax=Promicromonospora sp. NPDC052451 TaxID=3364407 RepID=UPI0037C83AF9